MLTNQIDDRIHQITLFVDDYIVFKAEELKLSEVPYKPRVILKNIYCRNYRPNGDPYQLRKELEEWRTKYPDFLNASAHYDVLFPRFEYRNRRNFCNICGCFVDSWMCRDMWNPGRLWETYTYCSPSCHNMITERIER